MRLELTHGTRKEQAMWRARDIAFLAKRTASNAKAHFTGNSLLGMSALYKHLSPDPNLRIRMVL